MIDVCRMLFCSPSPWDSRSRGYHPSPGLSPRATNTTAPTEPIGVLFRLRFAPRIIAVPVDSRSRGYHPFPGLSPRATNTTAPTEPIGVLFRLRFVPFAFCSPGLSRSRIIIITNHHRSRVITRTRGCHPALQTIRHLTEPIGILFPGVVTISGSENIFIGN
ncbi:hypothetical protein SAMN04488121_10750 [Chitinophaga filiformis]|uniref:Uncharacterized protein n=1 Tax=Chitinophaga filiformis TaxID=104663 RepID=A0A1G7XRK5_CHIFI|nr:hypothetical protein SAMN04488121_10750 [Chitinophaga filiformis]